MPNQIKNISVKSLFNLPEDRFELYHDILKYLKPMPRLGKRSAKDIETLTFGEVVSIRQGLNDPDADVVIEMFCLVFGIKKTNVLNSNVIDFYHAFNWIKDQIIEINDREQNKLSSAPDGKLKEAGIEELNVFGELNTLIALGEKFGKSPEEIKSGRIALFFH